MVLSYDESLAYDFFRFLKRPLGGLQDELDELELQLGTHVDLLTPGDLPPKFRAKVLAEAQPV
jgi:predicted nucleotidyltransferase